MSIQDNPRPCQPESVESMSILLELYALNKRGWIVFEIFSQVLKVEWKTMKNQSIRKLLSQLENFWYQKTNQLNFAKQPVVYISKIENQI